MPKVILVVDDTPTVRTLAQYALSRNGYQVILAEDGVKGLQASKLHEIDLIISDITMPHMDGLEMVKEIRNDPKTKDVPVFILTADHAMDTAKLGKSIGVNAWIIKPFVPDKLLEAVKKVLGK